MSSSSIKEILVDQLNELNRNFTSANTQILIKSQRIQELEQFETLEKAKREQEKQEMKQFKKEVNKEVKLLRHETEALRDTNMKYRKTILSLKMYLERISQADDLFGQKEERKPACFVEKTTNLE